MRRRPDVLWRVAPGHLLLSTLDGTMISVSGPGADVWMLLDDDVARTEIVEVLAERYGADPATVARDLEPLFAALVDGGYVADDA